MRMEDTIEIAASRQAVWDFLLDPQQVGACGPGVESIEVIDEQHFRAIVKIGIAQFRARFTVNLELADLEPIEKASVRAKAQAPGTAVDAVAHMQLDELAPDRTRMHWEADVTVSGQLAAVGGRLIQWTANKLIGQTFGCVQSRLAAAPDGAADG